MTSPRCRRKPGRCAAYRGPSKSVRSSPALRWWRTSRSRCRREPDRASAFSATPPTRPRSTFPPWPHSKRLASPTARAGELSHGEKRALELAIALAMQPRLLLLDEPMAGIGRDETERLVNLLLRLKGQLTMVLVEHDMAAVFALADRISVLIRGRLLTTGSPAQVRADPQVVTAYLGEQME